MINGAVRRGAPNNAGYWGASPSAEDYGRLLHDTAAAIRDTDAAAMVIAGATAGLVPTFTEGYPAAGVRKGHVDIITYP